MTAIFRTLRILSRNIFRIYLVIMKGVSYIIVIVIFVYSTLSPLLSFLRQGTPYFPCYGEASVSFGLIDTEHLLQ